MPRPPHRGAGSPRPIPALPCPPPGPDPGPAAAAARAHPNSTCSDKGAAILAAAGGEGGRARPRRKCRADFRSRRVVRRRRRRRRRGRNGAAPSSARGPGASLCCPPCLALPTPVPAPEKLPQCRAGARALAGVPLKSLGAGARRCYFKIPISAPSSGFALRTPSRAENHTKGPLGLCEGRSRTRVSQRGFPCSKAATTGEVLPQHEEGLLYIEDARAPAQVSEEGVECPLKPFQTLLDVSLCPLL